MDSLIREDDYVVLMRNFDSGNMKVVPVTRNSIVHYGKFHFNPTPLIGSQYGSVFEIKDETMVKVDNFEQYNDMLTNVVSTKVATFDQKSQFSQEKIIKKKKKQSHSNIVTVVRPTLLMLNEMLFARDKIGGLRADVLSQMITLSNIQNGSHCLLMDHNLGMMTSAVMSRILPDGVCIQLTTDSETTQTTRKTMNMLNIRENECKDNLFSISVRDLHKIVRGVDCIEWENQILEQRDEGYQGRLEEEMLRHKNEIIDGDGKSGEFSKEQFKQILIKKAANRRSRNIERLGASKHLKDKSLDSLILVVQNDHPLHLLKLSYSFLATSGRFVIYSNTVDPLLECHQYLKANSLAVSLNVSESWFRKYQVLPDRTRPEMNTSGYGGYLLSGTKALFAGSQADNNHDESIVQIKSDS